MAIERVQLEGPLQDVKNCREQLRLQIDRVEDRALVDQVGEAAHALHLRHFGTGRRAFFGKYGVAGLAQLQQPPGGDEIFQDDEALSGEPAPRGGAQRSGRKAQLQ